MSAAAPEVLRDRLAEIETEHATLRSELAAFQSDYLRLVGVVDVQVQELEAKILAIVAARSGVLDDQVAAEAAEQRFRETTTAMGAIPAPAGPPPSDDLKTLFRDAAKRMHPDLVQDEAGRAHAEAFMKRLNQAYKAGDSEGIGNLVRQWETSPYAAAAPCRPLTPRPRCTPRSPTPRRVWPRPTTPTSPASWSSRSNTAWKAATSCSSCARTPKPR